MRRGVKLWTGIPTALVGTLVTIAGLALLAFVGVDGTFTTPRTTATTDTHAIVFGTEFVDDDLGGGVRGIDGSITVEVESRAGELFVGVGDADDVAAYLEGVRVADATELSYPGGVVLRPRDGPSRPGPPADEPIWTESRVGDGQVTWTLDEGTWSLVLMNADGSAGVDVVGTATAKIPALGRALVVVLVIGIGLVAIGLGLIVSALRTRTPASPVASSRPAMPRSVPPRPDRP